MHTNGDNDSQTTITESVIFMLLSERNLGPKLYGIFPGGRLEEYISARALTCSELCDSDLSAVIARKLANVHSLNVPINKEPIWLFKTIYTWLETVRKINIDSISSDKRPLASNLLSFDFDTEVAWLKHFLRKANSPSVFCHNDLQEGNILLTEYKSNTSSTSPNASTSSSPASKKYRKAQSANSQSNSIKELNDRVVLIDFEYCAYNYRGFDIANHFCEWALDYSNPEYPHFYVRSEDYPNEEQRRHFIRNYLQWASTSGNLSKYQNTEEQLLKEAEYFTLASHMLWTLWSINNAYSSQIVFGYWVCLNLFLTHFQLEFLPHFSFFDREKMRTSLGRAYLF
ncbi:choline/ethanolamine kinase-like protein [Dinothrombium tinctorium]|uniref:Choline/ethanolamine kinase-like protein n=2 Tax=Dinothrombium tinctorium TaxID=1965070 RepID=A0A443QHR7_9ACAR|nr:choline/ethanolamine kinase-like protein [Dinothrombium tinctorium]